MSGQRFLELQKQIFFLFAQNRLDEALDVVNLAHVEYPARLDKISFWQACIYSLQGKTDEAIAALVHAIEQGVWWNPQQLIGDPDLKSLQEIADFQSILDQCKEIYEKESKLGKVELDVYGNQNAYVTIFSLHMRGMNAKDFAQFWFDQESLDRCYFAFPQSSQVFSSNGYCWDDFEVVKKDILEAYQLMLKKWTPSDHKLILGGGSQGGKVALEMLLADHIPEASVFILVVPSISKLEPIESLLKKYKRKNLKGCIITGDQDYCYNNIVDLVPMLKAHDIDCKLIVKEGVGHYFPDDFADLAQEAVEYIVG